MQTITILGFALFGHYLGGRDWAVTGLLIGALVELICFVFEPKR